MDEEEILHNTLTKYNDSGEVTRTQLTRYNFIHKSIIEHSNKLLLQMQEYLINSDEYESIAHNWNKISDGINDAHEIITGLVEGIKERDEIFLEYINNIKENTKGENI